MIKKRKRKGRSKSKAIPVTYKGINFKSKLERSMYRFLCSNKIEVDYEKETFILQDKFVSSNVCYERQMNGKGDFKETTNSHLGTLSYTPDFTGYDFIIETKGWVGTRFPLIWKLFKKHLMDIGDERMIFKPQSLTDCAEVVRLIQQKRLNDKQQNKTKTIK